jgi:predicted GNAT superfamily acetyltransferase
MTTKTHRGKSPAPPKAPAEIVVRHCHGLADLGACIEIERAVWGGADIELVPLPLLAVAAEAGGQVLGAFDGDRMVGFTMAIAGRRGRRPFLHSHMTGVLDAYRNRGVGRSLKLFQREDALSRGIDLIEWTFDPLQLKNAYFNLVRLGAIARRFLPNLYGITTSPLHAGLPTDRLVAEWWLRSARVKRAIAAATPAQRMPPRPRGREWVRIRVPALIGTLLRKRPDEAARLQGDIRLEFEHWLGRGYAATFIEVDSAGGSYLLEPWRKP